MIWLFVAHEVVNSEVSFDCDQSSLPEHKRRLPRWDKLRIFIEERLLDEPGSIEAEILIEVGHPLRFVSGLQRDFICLKVIRQFDCAKRGR